MTLGFLGTGAIAAAMVKGLGSGGGSILLSPRNASVAAELAGRFPNVSVASANQEVVDRCETVVVAVRPQVAAEVLSALRFPEGTDVISLVSGHSVRTIRKLVAPAVKVCRAVPLPSCAQRRSPTAIFPPDPAAFQLFSILGAAFEVDREEQFDAFCTATATMAAYFAFADTIASWLTRHGIPDGQAREYLARIHSGLAYTALEHPERSFEALAADHATRGGINEQVVAHLRAHGSFEALSDALDAVMRRVTAG